MDHDCQRKWLIPLGTEDSFSNTSAATDEESRVRAASDRAPLRMKDRMMKDGPPGEKDGLRGVGGKREGGRGEEE